jgi:hypothetical protein
MPSFLGRTYCEPIGFETMPSSPKPQAMPKDGEQVVSPHEDRLAVNHRIFTGSAAMASRMRVSAFE